MSEFNDQTEIPNFGENPIGWFATRYRVLLLRRSVHRGMEILRYALVRPENQKRFHIVSAQRNMGETALRCLESIHAQDYPKDLVRHIFIDDASTDSTPDIVNAWLRDHPGHRVEFIHNTERIGMLANNLAGFHLADETDIGIELNGDDWLPDNGVLRFLNKVYDDDDVWMTYNTLRQTDGTIVFQLPPPRAVRESLGYRQAPWGTSHLRTFLAGLYHNLPEDHLKDPTTGEYWDTAGDMAVYFAMLEMAGEHARHIYRITCTYHPHAMSDHIRDRETQVAADRQIRSLTPCRPLTGLSPPPSPPSS